MQAYIFNKEFVLVRIIDSFTSFIWNEVYIGYGDFEIKFVMDENALAYVDEGYYVSIDESDRYMIVDTIDIETSFTEGKVCTISGRGLESILERRVLPAKAFVNGSMQLAIMRFINETLANPADVNKKVEGFSVLTSTDPEITKLTLQAQYEAGDNLYDIITNICSEKHIGFRVDVYNEKFFQFRLYRGEDHSYDQTTYPWIVFSAQYENLVDSLTIIDTSNHKNVIECDIEITQDTVDEETGDIITNKYHYHRSWGSTNLKGLDRREIYASYSIEADSIDKSAFGRAVDRVNIRDYQEWMLVYFDSKAYNAAMDKYTTSVSGSLDDGKPRKIGSIVRKKTEEEGFIPEIEGTSAAWINTIREDVYEDPEVAAARAAQHNASLWDNAPKKEAYETWGWVVTNQSGYDAALAAEQAIIDAEYARAQEGALNYALELCHQKALEELLDPKYRDITKFEGDVDPNVNFVYGTDYKLGDIVQVVNQYAFNAVTRVTSVLISWDDTNGYSIIPTFTSDDAAKVSFDLPDYSTSRAKGGRVDDLFRRSD